MPEVPFLGKIRRSQVITTYGIGAIVDLEPGSFVPLGLEEWEKQTSNARKSSFIIFESRLQSKLRVDEFRMAPMVEDVQNQPDRVKSEYSIPVVRFPRWLECPSCHRLGWENSPFELEPDSNRLTCVSCSQRVNPVRFVTACANGHMSDFPWIWWAHRNRDEGVCQNPVLFLRSRGKSAALSDLTVVCRNCNTGRSLGTIFKVNALIELKCKGQRIWLLDKEQCDLNPRTLQRGASNVHFAATVSALSIPPVSEPVFQALDEHWSIYRGMSEETLKEVLTGAANELGIPVDVMLNASRNRKAIEAGEQHEEGEGDIRIGEYAALSASTEDIPALGGHVSQFENTISNPPPELQRWFDRIGAVTRLREVRAMVGFSRIEPQASGEGEIVSIHQAGGLSPLSKTVKKWLPAAEIRGEGIFFRFSTSAIDDWLEKWPAVKARADQLERWSQHVAETRGYDITYRITPRLLLVHAFAHAMIRQLAIECGYSSSALRERLYVKEQDDSGEPMHGVLIYTGTPDSEGSLGGLVRLANPQRLAQIVQQAIKEAEWCGSDPVCLETEPDIAGERVSGAACHCCLLVPETACEKFNKELDRTMLVGSADGSFKGFFSK